MKRFEKRQFYDRITIIIMKVILIVVFLISISIFIMLMQRSQLVLSKYTIKELLFSSAWDPERYMFGFFPAIIGTFIVTLISIIIAVPLSILSSIYISEYAHSSIRPFFQSFIDVLSGIPSVVFGIFSLLVIVPFVGKYLGPAIGIKTTGMCIFSAAIILAVMVFPIIISISVESLKSLPIGLREQFLSLGATKWQMIERVLLRAAGPGIISGIILGFGRAFGETMAVAMVIGNKNIIPYSLFSPGQTLPSLIVSSFNEMMSIPIQESSLIFVTVILLMVITVFNILANYIKNKLKKRWRYE